MRTLLAITLATLTAISAIAGPKYIAIAMRTDTVSVDKQAVRSKLKQYFEDVTEISLSDLPIWTQTSDPTKTWWVVCYAVDVGEVRKLGLSKADVDQWKDNNLNNPARVQVVACGMRPYQDLIDAGLTPPVDPFIGE